MDQAIAIVGISCRFAGCGSPSAFWSTILSRKSMLSVPGPEAELPFGQANFFRDRPFPSRIGQLDNLYSCIRSMHHFPRQMNAGENQDLYFATQLAFDALSDAGMNPFIATQMWRGSVRLGYAPPFNGSTVNWLQHTSFLNQTIDIIRRFMPNAPDDSLDIVREKLRESLPDPSAASFLLGSGFRFVSWIARECRFSGVATIMDAGNLSGAASVLDAVNDLRSGAVDVALAGALSPPLNRSYLEGLSAEVDFSTGTELHPFENVASGTIPGEGGAFFVLKRREDALRDRDRIYALIRAVEIGHSPEDDPSALFATALRRQSIPIKTIGLVEADGSGIMGMERREISIIQSLWGPHAPGGPLVGVGSVKGNIGHTLKAAMAAGLAKAALALRYRVLPPQVTPDRTLDMLSQPDSSAYLLTDARPWITGDSANPRRAAVMGFNFDPCNPEATTSRGGRSAVILLEEEPEARA